MTKKGLTLLAVSLALLLAETAQAATGFSFSPAKINVKEGQEFRVNISVNPNGAMNYTVKAGIKFPVDLVKLKTWIYADGWIPIEKDNYDYLNNTSGVLIKTAGYPKGFDKVAGLGSAVFVAKKSGLGVIEFTGDSLALNENNSNLYASGNKLAIIVSAANQINQKIVKPPLAAPSAGLTASSSGPEIINPLAGEAVKQLFDIALTIENALLNKPSGLIARTQFTSFGTVPTPVILVYIIKNADGDVVFSEKNEITVETEQLVTKRFERLNLGNGKYTLILNTTYGNNISDEFKQEFVIKAIVKNNLIPFLAGLTIIVLLAVAAFFYKSKGKKFWRNNKMKNFIKNNTKIIWACIIFIILLVGLIYFMSEAIKQNFIKLNNTSLQTLANEKAQQVESFLNFQKEKLEIISSMNVFKEAIMKPNNSAKIKTAIIRINELKGIIPGISLMNSQGIVSAGEIDLPGTDYSAHPYFVAKRQDISFTKYYDPLRKKDFYAIIGPIYDNIDGNKLIGRIAFDVELDKLSKLMKETVESETNEVYLIDETGLLLSGSEYISNGNKNGVLIQEVKSDGAEACLGGIKEFGKNEVIEENAEEVSQYANYMGDNVFGAYAYVPEMMGCVIAEKSADEIIKFSIVNYIKNIFNK